MEIQSKRGLFKRWDSASMSQLFYWTQTMKILQLMQSDTSYTTAAKNMILDKKFLSIIWKVRRLITKPFSCDLTTSEQTEDDVSQV